MTPDQGINTQTHPLDGNRVHMYNKTKLTPSASSKSATEQPLTPPAASGAGREAVRSAAQPQHPTPTSAYSQAIVTCPTCFRPLHFVPPTESDRTNRLLSWAGYWSCSACGNAVDARLVEVAA